MKTSTNHYLAVILSLLMMSSCTNEEPCTVNDFIGTWQITNEFCSVHDSPTVDITQGDSPSWIVINLDMDTFSLIVSNCEARHESTRFLYRKEAVATLDGDRVELQYNAQAAILPLICNLELEREQ